MALIKCRNCGHYISDKAERCPKCHSKNIVEGSHQLEENAQSTEGHSTKAQVENPTETNIGQHKKKKISYLFLFLTVLTVLGGTVGYFLYIDHQNKMAEALYKEQQRQDSIAAARLEAARLDSLRQDSIERRNFITPDLAFAELHGKVRQCKYVTNWCPLNQYREFEFDENGKLTQNAKIKFTRNNQNQIIESYEDPDPELEEAGSDGSVIYYSWRDDKLIKMKDIYGIYAYIYHFKYNDDGTLKSIRKEFYEEDQRIYHGGIENYEYVIKFSNYKFDEMGNWIKRNITENGQQITQTRIIKYYGNSENITETQNKYICVRRIPKTNY